MDIPEVPFDLIVEVEEGPARRSASVEFSWQGDDEGDEVSGRGWAGLADDGSLQGHLYFHLGDDSGFRAVRVGQEPEVTPSARQPP